MTLAFTLIELVVVIAVIAILSAVSVAAYMGVISSARKSNDLQELTQIKTEILTELLDGSESTSFSTSSTTSITFIYNSDKTITVKDGSNATSLDTEGGNSSDNTKNTALSQLDVSHALTGLVESWNSSAVISVTLESKSIITEVKYQRNMTDLTTFAVWNLKADTIETKAETTALVKGTNAYTGEAASKA